MCDLPFDSAWIIDFQPVIQPLVGGPAEPRAIAEPDKFSRTGLSVGTMLHFLRSCLSRSLTPVDCLDSSSPYPA